MQDICMNQPLITSDLSSAPMLTLITIDVNIHKQNNITSHKPNTSIQTKINSPTKT